MHRQSMSFIRTAIAFFLLVLQQESIHVDASTAFQLSGGPQCDKSLSIDITSLECGDSGSSICELGDHAQVTGSIDIGTYGLFDAEMEHKACIFGINLSWTCQTFTDSVNLCSLFGFDEDECPVSGSYDFDAEFEIPGEDGADWGSSWWVVVTSTITNNDGTGYTCKTTINAVNGSSSSGGAYMLGMGAILGTFGLATAFFIKKRRMATGKINLAREEEQASTESQQSNGLSGHFEIMQDHESSFGAFV